MDQLTAVVKNSNEDSSQTHKAQNGTILGRKSHKPFKNDHARLRIVPLISGHSTKMDKLNPLLSRVDFNFNFRVNLEMR